MQTVLSSLAWIAKALPSASGKYLERETLY